MSHGADRIDRLTDLYMSQSAGAFTVFASAAKKPNDHEQRVDDGPHGGITPCSDQYPCCTDSMCKPGCNAVLILLIAGGCVCCCYVTHGFGGVWPYWPA
ncbi:MAG: hypothetical protein RBQ77_05765 [Candidatus Methanomethylophilaceae archaeon]|jgi:hypothetical protein|nr:hypothetical protein [Candidatus Methanomethylophilaceae archaeon]